MRGLETSDEQMAMDGGERLPENPVMQTRLAAFATDHGLPQERVK
jgi:hypothetical protein